MRFYTVDKFCILWYERIDYYFSMKLNVGFKLFIDMEIAF